VCCPPGPCLADCAALVTALSPVIGYDKASTLAHRALERNLTLKAQALETGWVDEQPFDKVVDPQKKAHPT